MSRLSLPYRSDDISGLARALAGQLGALGQPPSHLELLNMLARAGGFRNFQHFRAQGAARARLDSPPPKAAAPVPVDYVRIRRLLRLFDEAGRLTRWPHKESHRELCLWALWARLPARCVLAEKEVNQRLNAEHLFGDHALLRRWLVELGLMTRTRDGREYRRVERRPPPDALELIGRLSGRAGPPG